MTQQSPTLSADQAVETTVILGDSANRRRLASKLSEIILGGQDGLVNVAGVILGLAAATSDTRIIIAGGLAATFAESISMAAVAYTSTLANRDHYSAEVMRQKEEIKQAPEIKRGQVARLFQSWGFKGRILDEVVENMTQNDGHWAELLVANDLKLQPVEENGLLGDSILVGVSAVIGSFIPLWPFFFFPPNIAIWLGLLCTAVTLYAGGVIKAKLTVGKPSRSGLQMLVIGMLAALVGYAIGLFFTL